MQVVGADRRILVCVSMHTDLLYYLSLHALCSLNTPPFQQSLGISQLLHGSHGRLPFTAVTNGHW